MADWALDHCIKFWHCISLGVTWWRKVKVKHVKQYDWMKPFIGEAFVLMRFLKSETHVLQTQAN